MTVRDPRDIRAELEDNHTKADLKQILEDELGNEYTQEINSQRNDLIEAFFRRVDADPKAVTHKTGKYRFDELLEDHGRRHALATALNYYLSSQGIRPREATHGLTKDVLSSMITAIRLAEQSNGDPVIGQDRDQSATDSELANEDSEQPDQDPDQSDRATPGVSPEGERFLLPTDRSSLSAATRDALETWLESKRDEGDGTYAVYVLDCTPPSEGEGRPQGRIETAKDKIENESLDVKQRDYTIRKAAAADRVYYVGETNDVVTRIDQHLGGPADGGSWFPNLFEPNHVEEVHWYQTKAEAENHEQIIGKQIDQRGDSIFVYWD